MAGLCADCTACCTVFEVKEVPKAFGEDCKHLGQTMFGGRGCLVYAERPLACQRYVCVWLDSQRRPEVEAMPEEMRPNVSNVVMGYPWATDRETMFVYPMPGHDNAWRVGIVAEYLQMILSRGAKVVVVTGDTRTVIKDDMMMIGTEAEFAELLK